MDPVDVEWGSLTKPPPSASTPTPSPTDPYTPSTPSPAPRACRTGPAALPAGKGGAVSSDERERAWGVIDSPLAAKASVPAAAFAGKASRSAKRASLQVNSDPETSIPFARVGSEEYPRFRENGIRYILATHRSPPHLVPHAARRHLSGPMGP